MAYEVFCRKRNGHTINELFTGVDKAVDLFIKLSKLYPEVHLAKRRKTKLKDDWRDEKKDGKDTEPELQRSGGKVTA